MQILRCAGPEWASSQNRPQQRAVWVDACKPTLRLRALSTWVWTAGALALSTACGTTPIQDQGTPLPPSETVVDVFRQEPQPSLDILWLVDNTRSMKEELNKLSGLFEPFIEELQSRDIGWQVGVITTDVEASGGQLLGVPSILTPSVPNAAQVFAEKMTSVLDEPSSAQEQGLHAIELALSGTNIEPGETNFGFLRPDALLSVIVVSDSDDSSANEVDYYQSFLLGLKGGAEQRVRFDAVVGPQDGCPGALPGTRYIALASALGGTVSSICSQDWTTLMEALGQSQITGHSQFLLSREPYRTDDMVVTVDGAVSEPGGAWSFDEAVRAVVFGPQAIPPLDAVIRVTYQAVVPGQSEQRSGLQ